ncbi:MAG: IS630 family transposase [Phycisphaerae bacterium]|nr:IS630 family transposase [Phycisphaerae bacterium]
MDIRLSNRERKALEAIARQQCGEARIHRRARMVLLAATGERISSVARKLGTSRYRVSQWLARFQEHRLNGLGDLPRSGRPPEITPLERHQVIATACRSPSEFGLHRTLWTHATLSGAVTSAGLVRSISTATVGRILDEAEIKPHHVKMWCHSNDPAYQDKMRAIVDLYINLPKGEPVLSIDEKSGMQALSRCRELQPAAPGRDARFEFEYKRNGTRCLFPCFNVATGKVLGRCTTQRKRPDFLSFMDLVASVYRQRRIHVVLDNLNTHRDTSKGAFMTEWNGRHGNRFIFHYTPTHGSWLNQIELWFCIVTRRILRFGNFHSPDKLVAAIEAFIEAWNEKEAHPFRWTYDGLPLVR